MEPNFVGIVAFPTTVPTKWFVGTKAAIPTHYLRKFVGTVCQRVSACVSTVPTKLRRKRFLYLKKIKNRFQNAIGAKNEI
jgi:hypothetical protein